MADIEIQIKPDILKWIINHVETAGLPQPTIDLMHSWLAGKRKPTFEQVEEISNKTHIPFGYFFLNSPPHDECEVVEYRTIDSSVVMHLRRELIRPCL